MTERLYYKKPISPFLVSAVLSCIVFAQFNIGATSPLAFYFLLSPGFFFLIALLVVLWRTLTIKQKILLSIFTLLNWFFNLTISYNIMALIIANFAAYSGAFLQLTILKKVCKNFWVKDREITIISFKSVFTFLLPLAVVIGITMGLSMAESIKGYGFALAILVWQIYIGKKIVEIANRQAVSEETEN